MNDVSRDVPRALPRVAEGAYGRRFRELVDEHGPTLARVLRYLGVAGSDIDDALQEVFVTAHRRWAELNDVSSVGGWLRGVAVNIARNRRRAARRTAQHLGGELAEPVDPRMPEHELAERQRCARLLLLLNSLPDDLRTALVLFEIESAPMKEVAEALGVSLPTAYRRVEEARVALKKALTKEER